MNRQTDPGESRLQRGIATVLAVLFRCALVAALFIGIGSDPGGILESLRTYHARGYLRGSAQDPFAMAQARILSLDTHLSGSLPLSNELGELNASFQFALGKNTVISGSESMLRLSNGQLYYIAKEKDLSKRAEEVIAFRDWLDGRVPFLFVYVHPGFFNGGLQLPEGYADIDRGDEMADELLAALREAGVDTMDSRTFFEDTGLTNDDLEYRTDRHWNCLAGLLATRRFAEAINERTGASLDLARLDLSRFELKTAPWPFLGSYGEKIGRNAKTETVGIYLPAYDTDLSRHTHERSGEYTDRTGPFEESVFRADLFNSQTNGVSNNSGAALGVTDGLEELVNRGDCEDLTILIVRDSFSSPICSYLSLTARRVVSIDTRWDDLTARQVFEMYEPDIVIGALSRRMMEKSDLRLM